MPSPDVNHQRFILPPSRGGFSGGSGGGPGGGGPGGGGPGGGGPDEYSGTKPFGDDPVPTLGADLNYGEGVGSRLNIIVQTFDGLGAFINEHQVEIFAVVAGVVLIGTAEIWIPAAAAAAAAIGAESLIAGAAAEAAAAASAIAASPTGQIVGSSLSKAAAGILAGGVIGYGSGAFNNAEAAPNQADPLVLDLNGDGIKTTNLENGVLFDHDNNGFAEWSNWVDDNDGILAIDTNNNGVIDNGSEIFGNNMLLPNSTIAADGFSALAYFDSNSDGVVDSNDTDFSKLKILKGDGTLLSLQEAGIQSLQVGYTSTDLIDINGNTQVSTGTFTKTDNSTGTMGDVNFITNTAISSPLASIEVSEEIADLPDVTASGNVYDLRQAMGMDTTNTLKGLVEGFISSTNETDRNSLIDQILATWSGVSVSTNARTGGMVRETHAEIVEKFQGHYFQGQQNSFIGTVPAGGISQAYYELAENLYGKLMAQTQLADYFAQITWDQDNDGAYQLNLDGATDMIETLASTDTNAAIEVAAEFSRALNGLKWSLVSNYMDFYNAMAVLGSDFTDAINAAGKQQVQGTSEDDTLGSNGTGAWDTGSGHASRDTRAYALDGGAGNDLLQGSYNTDILHGGTGNDTLIGYDGMDSYYFNPGDGQDTIIEGNAFIAQDPGSPDTLMLGAGITENDLSFAVVNGYDLQITVNDGQNGQILIKEQYNPTKPGKAVEILVLNDGTVLDTQSIFATQSIDGTTGDDSLTGSTMSDRMYGGDGNDTLSGDYGSDSISGEAGNDTLYGQFGDDTLQGGQGNDNLYGEIGNDSLNGDAGNDYLSGGTGNNTLDGGSGNDTLAGDVGNDVLRGGTGSDTLSGWSGDDTYLFNPGDGQDEVNDTTGNDVISLGTGITLNDLRFTGDYLNGLTMRNITTGDSVFFVNELAYNNLSVQFSDSTLLSNAEVKALLQTDGTNGNDSLTGSNLSEKIYGYAGDDFLDALDGNDTLDGGNGNDFLLAGTGNDLLDGGAGNDILWGDSGDDIYIVDSIGDSVTEFSGEGTDLIQASVTYTLGSQLENLTLTGTSAINGAGNTLDNVITGNASDNVLSGDSGNDTMIGGLGNDTYVVDIAGDVVTENTGEGTDTVQASISYTLGNNLENLTLTGSSALNGVGNTLNNVLTGNSGDNSLDGGSGSDTMAGGIGNDTYMVDNTGDVVAENTSEGTDTIQASISYTLGSNVENLTLTGSSAINATGNALNNILIGNTSDNMLSGDTGNDTMVGGLGNDTYVVDAAGDVVTENAEEGIDTVQSSITYTLGSNVENLTLTGSSTINGTGNTLDNLLTGNTGNNSLTGGAGNDTLNGGGGTDTLLGGTGDDTYIIGATGLTITENASEGTDTVQSSITYTLSSNVENLTLTGSSAINGTGNTLNNVLTGNTSDNTLSGGTGNDTMAGGLGNDTYVVDAAGDVVTENTGEGTDTVQSSITYTLGSNVENLTLTGSSAINGTGNTLDNMLTGNTGNNSLTGGAGNDTFNGGGGTDTLVGGTGDDTYIIGATGITVTENASEGTDTVQSSITYTLGSNVENLTLTGSSAINGTGNTSDNMLTGNTGNNSLSGGAGNDTLNGGGGTDTLVGGTGNDIFIIGNTGITVTENASEGTDTVQSSITYTLSSNVENLTLTGNSAINATGNTLNNVLTGNASDNVLSGGTGNDTMVGDLGNDTYVVDAAGDVVTENAGEGTDTVQASVTYTLSSNVENLTLTGSSAINGTGNTLNNVLTGNTGNNSLSGGAGNDTLNGGGGTDTLVGGTGDDTYIIVATGITVTENANEGTDTVQSSITYTLGSNLENLTLTGSSAINGTGNTSDNMLTGNTGNNSLSGGAGNDSLDGGSGSDTLIGGTGNDTYVVDTAGDIVTENTSEGTDTVQSGITYTLGSNLENLTLTGSSTINGTGNTLDNMLTGNTGNNSLTGGAGNDTLDGGSGSDTLVGGTGNDTYIIDTVGDVITENAGEGTDTVQTNITYTLGSNLENLILIGTSAINGTGNTVDNMLTGNTGNNVLSGQDGNDYLNGTSGDDTLLGGAGNDTLQVGAGFVSVDGGLGNDLLISYSTSGTLSGGDGDDTIYNHGTATVYGGLGIDWIENQGNISGDAGADSDTVKSWGTGSFSAGDGNDYLENHGSNITLDGGAGADTLKDFGTGTMLGGADSDYMESHGTGGTSDGGTDNDTLNNYGNNTLLGGDGEDTLKNFNIAALYGGSGNDLLENHSQASIMDGGTGADTIKNFGTATSILGGDGADLIENHGTATLSGGAGNDQLFSMSGANTTFLFNLGDGQDLVADYDSGSSDQISFGQNIGTLDVAFFYNGSDLQMLYGNSGDMVTVQYETDPNNAVETVHLSNGLFMTDADINQLVADMTSYASTNSISLTSVNDVKNDANLMAIVSGGWHS